MIETNLWSILPSALAPFMALAERAARGEAIPAAIHAATQSQGNVAVLDMVGVLLPGDVPAWARGRATSMPALAQEFRDAAADPGVSAIVLRCDSPGGYAKGCQELSDAIYSVRGSKPMQTIVDGMCCSAALWAGSATGQIVIGSDTAQVGSIGVRADHVDYSGALASAGIRVTEVSTGKYKTAGSPNRPLDEVGLSEMQRSVDHTHEIFKAQLARNLGLAPSAVAKLADGRIFHGRESIDVGLASAIQPVHSALASFAAAHGRKLAVTAKAPPQDVAARAAVFIAQQAKLGKHVTACDAVAHIHSLA